MCGALLHLVVLTWQSRMAVLLSPPCGMLTGRRIAMTYDNTRALQLLRAGTGRADAQFRDGQAAAIE